MQAINRTLLENDWIAFVLVLCLSLLFILKISNASKLIAYSTAFFTKGFLEKLIDEKIGLVSVFNSILFLFSVIIISLSLLFISFELAFIQSPSFLYFLYFFTAVITYFIIKYLLEYVLGFLYNIQFISKRITLYKSSYLYTLAIWLYPLLILQVYALNSSTYFIIFALLLLIVRFSLIIYNNKNLIVSKLFYFILYLCALEIAPLLILFKLTTK